METKLVFGVPVTEKYFQDRTSRYVEDCILQICSFFDDALMSRMCLFCNYDPDIDKGTTIIAETRHLTEVVNC